MSNIFYTPNVDFDFKLGDLDLNYGVVQDIILNEEHDDYDISGFNVGPILYKTIIPGASAESKGRSFFAYPKEISFQEYPLIGEVVLIEKLFDRDFYTRRININKSIRDINTYPNLLEQLQIHTNQTPNAINQANYGIINRASNTKLPLTNEDNNSFKAKSGVNLLKHFAGDVIFQGRAGSSLRFSSSQLESALNGEEGTRTTTSINGEKIILGPRTGKNDPIVILRVGQYSESKKTINSPFGLTMEDINNDGTVLVMATDQALNFHHATTDHISHYTGYTKAGKMFIKPSVSSDTGMLSILGGARMILNSDAVVINSKKTNIIASSHQNIHYMARNDVTIDAGKVLHLTAKQIQLLSNKHISKHRLDSAVLAEPLEDILVDIITAFIGGPIGTGVGTVVASPNLMTALRTALTKLDKQIIRSRHVKLEKN